MKLMTLPSQASLDKGASLDPWGALTQDMHPDTSHSPLADAGTPQSGSRPPDPHLFPFSQNPSHSCSHPSNEFESGQLNIQMPPPNMATSDPQPHLFRHESDAMSTDDGGMSGGFSGGIPGMAGIPAAPPMFSVPVATGVAQAAVFSWTHQEYCASGTLREITCVEARVSFFTHPLHASHMCACDLERLSNPYLPSPTAAYRAVSGEYNITLLNHTEQHWGAGREPPITTQPTSQ